MLGSGMEKGAAESMDRLDESLLLAGEYTFTFTRVLEAPRHLVWQAHTRLDHLKRWWGPKGFTVAEATLDLRPGGLFHYGLKGPDGSMLWGRFIYREVSPEGKLVHVLAFSDPQGAIARHEMVPVWPAETLIETTLSEAGGKTTVTLRAAPMGAAAEERAAFKELFASMEGGYGGTYDQLTTYLEQTGKATA